MENEATNVVVPHNTHETLTQVVIKEAVKGIFALTVTMIGSVVVKRMTKRTDPIEVIIVTPPSTEEK